jgi:two-component system phosphate regulon sensor histidine kinase PhoR
MRRLVQRTAMFVQAEKCVIMVRDRESGDLVARLPAFGMTAEEVAAFRTPPDCGISGEVFRTGEPTVFHNADQDGRARDEKLTDLRIRNGVTVPLVIEKRDDDNRILERKLIGVLHCFNKRYQGDFIDEDVRLLERLSRNASSVIANAQVFQELVEEKQKLVHTLESLTAGLILVNQHGRISQMNAQARAMFGVPPSADPHGRPLSDFIQDRPCLEVIARKVSEAGKPLGAERDPSVEDAQLLDEITLEDKDGEQYIYQVHAADVRDDYDKSIGTVIIFNDITDIRNLERMKTEFVSIVSHELRTPLTPMKGFVRTLLDDENEEWYNREDRREFYTIIEENVDRLSRLINDLLNVSRIEKGAGIDFNWQEVDLRKATEAVVNIQQRRTDKHTLVLDFAPERMTVETDPDIIQNILQNLVSNAIKYSPEGGEVRIIARLEPADEEHPAMVLVGVKDQGLGIPEAYLKKLGQKFGTIRDKDRVTIGGTGIGLYLVKNLVAAHQGVMWPESEGPGKGSTFWFRIPAHQPKPDPLDCGPNASDELAA